MYDDTFARPVNTVRASGCMLRASDSTDQLSERLCLLVARLPNPPEKQYRYKSSIVICSRNGFKIALALNITVTNEIVYTS